MFKSLIAYTVFVCIASCSSAPADTTLKAAPDISTGTASVLPVSDTISGFSKQADQEDKPSVKRNRNTAKAGTGCVSQQCKGSTKKGRRCRNNTKSCNGYCYRHGG